jgi:hypothetical protein
LVKFSIPAQESIKKNQRAAKFQLHRLQAKVRVLTCSNQPGDSVVSTNTSNTLGRPKAYYLGKAEFGGEVGGASKRRRCTAAPRSLTPRGR